MAIPWYLKHAVHGNKPWAVQREALNRSEERERYGYFLEQGLGKTALTINDFLHYDDCDVMLNVAPNSFKLDWVLAFDEWGAGHIPTGYWPKNPPPQDEQAMAYAVNYEAVSRGRGINEFLRLMERRRVFLNIDESAEIKNPQSDVSKAVLELAKRAVRVRLNNGTPLVQNVMDYYPQLRCLGQLNGVNPYQFRNRHAVMGGFMGKVIQRTDKDGKLLMNNADELYRTLDACSFRALKKDWRKDLPPRNIKSVHLTMTNRQLAHYREMLLDFFTMVGDVDVSAELVLTQMGKLRQISSCLAMQDDSWSFIEKPKDNPKMRAIFDLLHGGRGKLIVVHVYRPSGQMLFGEFTKAKLQPARIAGGMSPEEIVREKKRFNEDPDCRVICCQERAAFRGHTLIGTKGDRANRMVFYENDFSWYQRSQMLDRNHRGEQDEVCDVWDLITSPADQFAIDVLNGKRDMADAVDVAVTAIRSGKWRL